MTPSWSKRVGCSCAGGPALGTTKLIAIGLIGVAALLVAGVVAIATQGSSAPSSAAVLATMSPTPRSANSITTSTGSATTKPVPTSPRASPADQGGNQDTGMVPDDGGLPIDNSARVTRAGDGWRVCTQPRLGGGSVALSPLLPAGTRVFVVDGPEPADGYDWYQVMTYTDDLRLFGGVAAGRSA